jgi:hypothetical protein
LDPRHIADLERQIASLQKQYDTSSAIVTAPGIPGSFITGRSGQSAAYGRKLDRQIERTVTNAGIAVKAKERMDVLRGELDAYKAGRINEQGRRVTMPAEKAKEQSAADHCHAAGAYPRPGRRHHCGEAGTGQRATAYQGPLQGNQAAPRGTEGIPPGIR